MTEPHTGRSPQRLLTELRARYPDSPFLALGQTVFWDEPMKAVLRRMLDDFHLGGQMVLGVHDTDYFAKAHRMHARQGRFALLPHNDGTTRDLWSAAGEISTLFGSETFPRRHDFARYGVPFDRIARAHPAGPQAFLDDVTEAWGWRGLVYTGSRDLIVHTLSLHDVGDGIFEMLSWGFENAIEQIAPGCCQGEARFVADTILNWCREFRAAHPDKCLTHLYQHLLPRLYELLLGHPPDNITVDCTAHLLRLTPETAGLPRFRFVDLFLNPATRDIAARAYNHALAGSEIYTLDKFGTGALPFDVVLEDRGRGTLRITPRVLFIETRQPTAVRLKKPIESIHDLAEVLAERFGDHVTLVGKAVSLISMLAQEFIFVFNEEGSMYVWRTRKMNDLLREQGIALDMRPILRMRYHTWDALVEGRSTLRPAPHLAAAFGQPTITTPEFAATWRQVVEEQKALCAHLATLRKPLDLLAYLEGREPQTDWEAHRMAYLQAKETLIALRREAAAVQVEVENRYARLLTLKRRGQAVEREMGEHFRTTEAWTPEATAHREKLKREREALEQEKRHLRAELVALKTRRLEIERSAEAQQARTTRDAVEQAAERARLHLVRQAILVMEGLPHTSHRPSAWWLPMIDSTGSWFRRIADTTELYTEPLLS